MSKTFDKILEEKPYLDWWSMDNPRNTLDEFKGVEVAEVKRIVKERSLPFAVLMSQLTHDSNFGSVVRSANFLGAECVYYYGNKKFDKRSAVGCHHYSDVNFLRSFDEVKDLKSQYKFVGMENNLNRKCQTLSTYEWDFKGPKRNLIIIGEEKQGIEDNLLDLCDDIVFIKNFGSVRSLNAASSATVSCYDFITKYESRK